MINFARMMNSLTEFFAASTPSVEAFSIWSRKYAPKAKADHICYKCSSTEEFEHLRSLFESGSEFIYQSIISKRRIAIIKFIEPLKTPLGDILFLELSDQKPDNSQISGFDHVEIYPVGQSLDELVVDLEQKGTTFEKVIRPHHTTFDAKIFGNFKIRLEDEQLVQKIKREEMR
jgi:hypothetical protein